MKRVLLIFIIGFLFAGNAWADNSIVGSWDSGNSSETTIFYQNGFYIHYAAGDGNDCYEGVEYGTYSHNNDTGKITFSNVTDKNGTCGPASISDPNYTLFVSGDTLTINVPSEGGIFTFQRILSDSIVGSWTGDSEADPSVANPWALTFYDDGHYIHYQNGDGTDCVTGVESGTYSYNSTDGTITLSMTKDTNGTCGFSDEANNPLPIVISGDLLTMVLSDGTITATRVSIPSIPITQNKPSTPTLSSPSNISTDVSLTLSLTTNAFLDPDTGDTHLKTDWEISISADFSSSLLKVQSKSNLTTLIVPDMTLQEGITYYWKARFYDDKSTASDWAEPYSFTTLVTHKDTNTNGIPDTLENTIVDLDADGIADIAQTTVIKTLNTVVGSGQMGASIKESTTITTITEVNSIDPDTISEIARPDSMPLGLFSLRATVANPGDTGNVTIYFSEAAPSNAIWYFYDSINEWTDYSQYATFSSDRKSVNVQLKDGGHGDSDGIANGIIVDPSGFGIASWIKGVVSDSSTGQIISTATLNFEGIGLSLNSLRDGNFLSMILPGTYNFTVSAPNYTSQTLLNVPISEGAIVTKDIALSSKVTEQQVAELYVATFNRAPDTAGLNYWVSCFLAIEQIAKSFFDQPETQSLYPAGNTDTEFVTAIYQNLFNRVPDAAGLSYWIGPFGLGGGLARSVMIEALKNGATGADRAIIDNKTEVGLYCAKHGSQAVEFSLSGITDDPTTLEDAKKAVDDL